MRHNIESLYDAARKGWGIGVDDLEEAFQHLTDNGIRRIEPKADTESRWLAHHDELAAMTLVAKTPSWYTGANIKGKPQRLLSYIGGLPAYIAACDDVKQKDYAGFDLA